MTEDECNLGFMARIRKEWEGFALNFQGFCLCHTLDPKLETVLLRSLLNKETFQKAGMDEDLQGPTHLIILLLSVNELS